MAQKTRKNVKVEETRKEIHCSALGLKYRSDMVKIISILETPESRAEIDQHCGPTATEFKNRFAGIGRHIPSAGIAAVVVELLKCAVAAVWEFLKGGLN